MMIQANETPEEGSNGINRELAAAAALMARDAIEDIDVPRDEYIRHMVAKCLKRTAQ